MRVRSLIFVVLLLNLSLFLAGCSDAETNQDSNLTNPVNQNNNLDQNQAPTDEVEEPTEDAFQDPVSDEINLVEFSTNDGVFYMLYPENWATNQVPLENGLSFGIVPLPEHLSAGPSLFNDPVIMVYGSVQQVSPDLAIVENLENFHVSTFYSTNSPFSYVIVGEPLVTSPTQYVTYYLTQATSTLSTGVLTHWLLGTALADQTVVSFAVGLPDHSMELYGDLAQQMFNSIEIDTSVTAELVE
jgi:hypothetical protein